MFALRLARGLPSYRTALAALALSVVGAAGCGSSEESTSTEPSRDASADAARDARSDATSSEEDRSVSPPGDAADVRLPAPDAPHDAIDDRSVDVGAAGGPPSGDAGSDAMRPGDAAADSAPATDAADSSVDAPFDAGSDDAGSVDSASEEAGCVPSAEICDGLDNDCNGDADETFPLKGTPCSEDGSYGTTRRLGLCRGTGVLACDDTKLGLKCVIDHPGAQPTNEQCNDVDDDCDGHIDEPYDADGRPGVRDVLTPALTINGKSVVMYAYEASRPNASDSSAGYATSRACSVGGRVPWAMVSWSEALAACNAAGMRLCKATRTGSGVITSDEWGRYCAGAANRAYPYGNAYQPLTCNGSDYDPVPGGANEDQVVATHSLGACVSLDGAFDMSGNLKEWTDDPRVIGNVTKYSMRGGSYESFDRGLACNEDLRTAAVTFRAPNLGFRCCSLACAAGQSECSGVCVDLATDTAHCGACGTSCAAGESCSNGYCCPDGTHACADRCFPMQQACP